MLMLKSNTTTYKFVRQRKIHPMTDSAEIILTQPQRLSQDKVKTVLWLWTVKKNHRDDQSMILQSYALQDCKSSSKHNAGHKKTFAHNTEISAQNQHHHIQVSGACFHISATAMHMYVFPAFVSSHLYTHYSCLFAFSYFICHFALRLVVDVHHRTADTSWKPSSKVNNSKHN